MSIFGLKPKECSAEFTSCGACNIHPCRLPEGPAKAEGRDNQIEGRGEMRPEDREFIEQAQNSRAFLYLNGFLTESENEAVKKKICKLTAEASNRIETGRAKDND